MHPIFSLNRGMRQYFSTSIDRHQLCLLNYSNCAQYSWMIRACLLLESFSISRSQLTFRKLYSNIAIWRLWASIYFCLIRSLYSSCRILLLLYSRWLAYDYSVYQSFTLLLSQFRSDGSRSWFLYMGTVLVQLFIQRDQMTLFYRSSNIYRAVFSLFLFFSCSSLSRCEITTLLSAFTFLFYSFSWIFYCFSPLFSYLKLAMILFCSSIFYNATLNCCFKSAIFSTISSILISFWSILSLSSRIVPSYLPFSFSQYILSFSYSISRNFAFSSRILMSLWLLVRKFQKSLLRCSYYYFYLWASFYFSIWICLNLYFYSYSNLSLYFYFYSCSNLNLYFYFYYQSLNLYFYAAYFSYFSFFSFSNCYFDFIVVLAAGLVLLAGFVGLVVVFVFFPGNLAGSRIKGASSSGGGSSLGTIVGLFVVVVGVFVGFGSVVVLAVLFVLVVVVLLVAAVVVLLVFDLLFVSDPATGLVSTFVSGLLFTPVSSLVSGAEVSAVFMVLALVLLVGFAGVVYGSGCYIFFCALAARVCALDITLLQFCDTLYLYYYMDELSKFSFLLQAGSCIKFIITKQSFMNILYYPINP